MPNQSIGDLFTQDWIQKILQLPNLSVDRYSIWNTAFIETIENLIDK